MRSAKYQGTEKARFNKTWPKAVTGENESHSILMPPESRSLNKQ